MTDNYEGSPADRRRDARMAKKRGVTLKQWESSAEDARMDKRRKPKERPDAQPKFDRVAKDYVR